MLKTQNLTYLLLNSYNQDTLKECYKSLIPSLVGHNVKLFSITPFKDHTPNTVNVLRTEYHPNKYLNKILEENERPDCIGMLNDDIFYSAYWLTDCLKWLKDYDCVSPGFVQSGNFSRFAALMDYNIVPVFFGSCYLFRTDVIDKIGKPDEEIVDWYDMDWYWRMRKAGLKIGTSKSITIHHFGTVSGKKTHANVFGKKKRDFKSGFINKFGLEDFKAVLPEMRQIRKYFIYE